MTTYAAAGVTLRDRAKTALIAAGIADAKQHHDNMPWKTPAVTERWARVTILPEATEQITLGTTPSERRNGVLVIQLFDPVEQGGNGLLTLADTLAPYFSRVTVSTVTFRTPTPNNVGSRSGSPWWQVNLTCPFFFPHQ